MSLADQLKFDQDGLIPAIARDAGNGEVLMMAFMNREAVEKPSVRGRCTIIPAPAESSG